MTKLRRYWAVCDDEGPAIVGNGTYQQYSIYPSKGVARREQDRLREIGYRFVVREVVVLELKKLKMETSR